MSSVGSYARFRVTLVHGVDTCNVIVMLKLSVTHSMGLHAKAQ